MGLALSGAMVLFGVACSSDADVAAAQRRVNSAEEAVAQAEATLEDAGVRFCDEAKDYIIAIDRYGKAFNDNEATVGDLTTLGADLAAPKESTAAAAQEVVDARDALDAANRDLADARTALREAKASAAGTSATPVPVPDTSSPAVPTSSVDRVKVAESDLEAATAGITDQTPLSQATQTFTSAAFALEAAWLNLFEDAGCLSDEQSAQAAEALRVYTVALQQELKKAGYLKGEADGVYGPETVAAVEDLQADAGLPVTGLVDLATRAALSDAVAQKGQSAATEELIQATSVQTTLKLAGYWPGPVDGQWTPELEQALKAFQKDLGVEPTGVVDAETLAAIEDALVELSTAGPTLAPTPSATSSPSG